MIGMHLEHGDNYLKISQKQYLIDLAKRFSKQLGANRPAATPAKANMRLTKAGIVGQEPSDPVDAEVYRSLVGSLMYAVVTGLMLPRP